MGKKLDEYLTRLEKFGFSGAAIASKNGEIILSKGYGWANREKKIPFTSDTVSSIGSITKTRPRLRLAGTVQSAPGFAEALAQEALLWLASSSIRGVA